MRLRCSDDRPRTAVRHAPERRPDASLPLPLDELIEMKIHGLDDLLEDVEGTAFADLPTRQLLEMAKFGVDRELISELDAAGYGDLQADEMTETGQVRRRRRADRRAPSCRPRQTVGRRAGEDGEVWR